MLFFLARRSRKQQAEHHMARLEKVLIRGGLLKGARYSVREYANREVLNREVNSHRYFENGDCHLSLKFGIFGQRH